MYWLRFGTKVLGLLLAAVALGRLARYIRVPAFLRKVSIDQWRAIDAETDFRP